MTDHLTHVSRELVALPKRPAGVFVTGDCAYNSGQIADYALRGEIAEADSQADQMPVHLALGNHDNRERFWNASRQEKAAKRPLADRQVALSAPRAPIGSCSIRWKRLFRLPVCWARNNSIGLPERSMPTPTSPRWCWSTITRGLGGTVAA